MLWNTITTMCSNEMNTEKMQILKAEPKTSHLLGNSYHTNRPGARSSLFLRRRLGLPNITRFLGKLRRGATEEIEAAAREKSSSSSKES